MHEEPLRLIEDCLPLDIISERAAREKSQRSGNLASLHTWWGRKPQIAARAAVYTALVPAPHDNVQREAYLRQLVALCDTTIPAPVLSQARRQIAEVYHERNRSSSSSSGAHTAPLIVDLFAGGGSIPLESLRLGCAVLAGDLNPVAYLIQLCTLVYPQRYPDLARQVATWGERLLSQVQAATADLYPPLAQEPLDTQRPITRPLYGMSSMGDILATIPSAFIWTRTVTCPNPQCEATVPLTPTTWLVDKPNNGIALRIVPAADRRNIVFVLAEASSHDALGFDPAGLSSRGQTRCICCGATVPSSYVKQQGKACGLGTQLMATVTHDAASHKRRYVAASNVSPAFLPDDQVLDARIAQLCSEGGFTIPDERIYSADSRAFFTHLYGLERFGDLFTRRQQVVLLTCIRQLHLLHHQMLDEGMEQELARAVATYLALLIDRLADWNSAICKWSAVGEGISNTFSRQALPMTWNFAEIYPFGDGWGNLSSALERMVETIGILARIPNSADVRRSPAHQSELPDNSVDAIVTDPPYYDNVPYADLSDFFYVWLKRSVGHLYPEHFSSQLTPKKWDAYVNPTRHNGDYGAAVGFYKDVIQRSLEEAHRILKPSAPMVLIYAHKTTAGWASIVDALRAARFMVTEAWPISTESRGRVRAQNSAALASSIFIVARKRVDVLIGNYTRDVLPELAATIRERVATLSTAGIGGADLVIATVGAGLRAYTRFARVELDNGDELNASTFLEDVQRAALSTILEHVVGLDQSGVSRVDSVSQYYVLARYQYGTADLDFDDANVLARGIGIELEGPDSLTSGATPVIVKSKNTLRLQDFRQRGTSRTLGLHNGKVAPLIDILHRLLWLNDHQPAAISAFLKQSQPDTISLRLVAEALAGKTLAAEPTPGVARDERTDEQKAIGRMLPVWRRVVEEMSRAEDKANQDRFL